MRILPVILSGGAGTRLWPLSRELYPKQLLPLAGERTMLQETVLRLDGVASLGAPLVVCNESHRFLVAEQLRTIDRHPGAIILEPVGRNTAPAVTVAALQAMCQGEDPLLLVLPADHVIRDSAALCQAIALGIEPAMAGALITFGIVATSPETGFGYIKRSTSVSEKYGREYQVFDVDEFVEKPDLATAAKYLAAGNFLWNSGMFLFKASTYLDELGVHAPEILETCRVAWERRTADLDFMRLDAGTFASCPSISIDYALMEKTGRAAVVPLSAGWSDVGSWSALWEISDGCPEGNVRRGDVIDIETHNSYLYAGSRLLATVGVRDLVVVETADAVLVANKERVQEVKQVVERLKTSGRAEHMLHRCVNRPWGTYEGLDAGNGFLVKRITVRPGAALSLQRHRQRAEHWVVVRGTARIVCGEEVLTRKANESIYIPIGTVHRLENPGDELLEIIEVQTGDYLGEDDIERLDDRYGRGH